MIHSSNTNSMTGYVRIGQCFKKSLPPTLNTILWLLKLMIPISFTVMILDYSGFLVWLSAYTAPLVKLLGLRGESALVLITSGFLNIYSAIAVMQSISFSMREITILAVMCLISHNLIIEAAVQKKTGSSGVKMVLLRIGVSLIAGYILNLLLPKSTSAIEIVNQVHIIQPFSTVLQHWFLDTGYLIIKIIVIISSLNFLQRLMDEFSITLLLSKLMSPLLRFFGLPPQASFMWLIANVIGLAWGSSVLVEQAEQGRISQREVDLLNRHIAISHSLLEDTLLFVALGVNALWLIFPRLFLAFCVVWLYRIFFIPEKVLKF